jgi:hypothetical protein
MADGIDPGTPPQDTGAPDPVETDPAALSAAEDLDEDRLEVDPQEEGMDPPERWSGADRYGTTPYEQEHPRGFGQRLGEEEPDRATALIDTEPRPQRSDDEASGRMAEVIRTPDGTEETEEQ